MQVGIPFQWELVLGEQRKYVNVGQVVVLRLLDCARNDAGSVVNKPVDKKRVEGLLNFDKNGATALSNAINIENGGLVVQNTWVLGNS